MRGGGCRVEDDEDSRRVDGRKDRKTRWDRHAKGQARGTCRRKGRREKGRVRCVERSRGDVAVCVSRSEGVTMRWGGRGRVCEEGEMDGTEKRKQVDGTGRGGRRGARCVGACERDEGGREGEREGGGRKEGTSVVDAMRGETGPSHNLALQPLAFPPLKDPLRTVASRPRHPARARRAWARRRGHLGQPWRLLDLSVPGTPAPWTRALSRGMLPVPKAFKHLSFRHKTPAHPSIQGPQPICTP